MNACAYVVGPSNGPAAALYALARNLGFDAVYPFDSIVEAERRPPSLPLSFFLFAEVPDPDALRGPARTIRASQHLGLKFSPLIYFSRNPSLDTIQSCIGMGFDDIITEPFSVERVGGRLSRQVGTELAFYESPDYFGPDRRRVDGRASPGDDRRADNAPVRRIEILRHPQTGISVLNDTGRATPMPADAEQVML